jgi:hypothetical protein
MRLSSVVLPEPRKPVRMVTGIKLMICLKKKRKERLNGPQQQEAHLGSLPVDSRPYAVGGTGPPERRRRVTMGVPVSAWTRTMLYF